MQTPAVDFEPIPRPPRSPSQAATLLLALFVFAAIPALSLTQGLDAAILAEFVKEQGRTTPLRDVGITPKRVSDSSACQRARTSSGERIVARLRVSAVRRVDLLPRRAWLAEAPCPADHHVRAAWLSLPPPRA